MGDVGAMKDISGGHFQRLRCGVYIAYGVTKYYNFLYV